MSERHVVNQIFRGVGKGVKLKNPLGESTSMKCNNYVNIYVSIQPIQLGLYYMEISSRHFLLGMENLLDASLPKIKPPASFFPLKVLEHIMEIILNTNFVAKQHVSHYLQLIVDSRYEFV